MANDYYIDASSGNDSWSGIYSDPQPAGCEATSCTDGPWLTLLRVNQGGFLSGDRILLRCGQTWRETLSVIDSGTDGNPISLTSYGTECTESLPVISASDSVSNWMPDTAQPNVYMVDMAGPVDQVFVDGQYLKLAQEPDSGYMLIDVDSGGVLPSGCIAQSSSRPGNCFLQDAELSTLTDLIGADIHIRTINWQIEDRVVTGFDQQAGEITWDTETYNAIKKDYGYYLDNKRWMLDSPGEWYHDATQGRLYVWLPDSSDPNQHLMEASVRRKVLDAENIAYVTFTGVAFVHAGRHAVTLSSVRSFILDSILVSDSGGDGIRIINNSQGTLQKSTIQRSGRDGIVVSQSGGTLIKDNQVINSGTVGSPKNCFAAIRGAASDGLTITDNEVTNAGNIGIRFKRNSSIAGNVVRNTCMVFDDCGAIYTYSGNDAETPVYNSVVDSNIIVDVFGNSEGRPPQETQAMGIYLDELSSGITVSKNIVVNSDRGIFFHKSNNHLVKNNTLFGNRKYQFSIANSVGQSANTVEDNVLFPRAYRDTMKLQGSPDNGVFGSFVNNEYSLINAKRVATETYDTGGSGTVITGYDFPGWKNQREPDAGLLVPFSIARSRPNPVTPGNMINNSAFDNGLSAWGRFPTNSIMEWRASCGWDAECVHYRASPDPVESVLISNALSLVDDRWYLVEFAARGEISNQTVNVIVRRDEPGNFENVGLKEPVTVGADWNHYRLVFKSKRTLSTARLEFNLLAGEAIELDDVRMFEVIANDPTDDAQILINDTNAAQALPCPDTGGAQESRCIEYVDDSGAPVAWPLNIAARSAEIIIWAADPFRDSDFDTHADLDDNCPDQSNSPQRDIDQDGFGDVCDAFPSDPTEWLDADGDGVGNNTDLDDDGDTLTDNDELNMGTNPLLADTDGDGVDDGLEVAAGTDPLDNTSTPELSDGDANEDGRLDAADLLIGLQILLGQRIPSVLELAHLDVAPLVNGLPAPDGQFNLGDYVVLQRAVTGQINF